jgi:hypothetical protein
VFRKKQNNGGGNRFLLNLNFTYLVIVEDNVYIILLCSSPFVRYMTDHKINVYRKYFIKFNKCFVFQNCFITLVKLTASVV